MFARFAIILRVSSRFMKRIIKKNYIITDFINTDFKPVTFCNRLFLLIMISRLQVISVTDILDELLI